MAIRDLFWACPICGREGTIQPARSGEACQGCATHFRRNRRALIVARQPGHSPLTLSPAEWLDRLPNLDIEKRVRQAAAQGDVIRSETATLRTEIGSQPIYFRANYLNRIERLGPPRTGILRLEAHRLSFQFTEEPGRGDAGTGKVGVGGVGAGRGHAGDAGAGDVVWDFDEIIAVQPSSSTLQINARGVPLSSLRVPGGSISLWEEFICAALRSHYRQAGRGEIIEFQPRISVRDTESSAGGASVAATSAEGTRATDRRTGTDTHTTRRAP